METPRVIPAVLCLDCAVLNFDLRVDNQGANVMQPHDLSTGISLQAEVVEALTRVCEEL